MHQPAAESPPPPPDDSGPFAEPAPRWPGVIGWTSVVLAGITFSCAGCGVGSLYLFRPMMKQMAQGGPLPPTMSLSPLDWLSISLGVMLTGVLLAGGLMLTARNPVGRTLHLVYAVLKIPDTGLALVLQLAKNAQMRQWIQDNPTSPFAQQGAGGAIGTLIGVLILVVLGLGWPIFCLIWFSFVKPRPEQMFGDAPPPAA